MFLLPWLAAISIAATAGAVVFSLVVPVLFSPEIATQLGVSGGLQTVFPYALGLCAAVGLPVALWLRAHWIWAVAAAGMAVMIGLLLIPKTGAHAGGGEAASVTAVFDFLNGVAAALLVGVPALVCLFVIGLPVGVEVLLLSGEIRAITRGVSILDLPGGRVRIPLLVLAAVVVPLATLSFANTWTG